MNKQTSFRRMTWTDRLIIERLYNSGHSYRSISGMTGFAVSSLHREIHRGLYLHRDSHTWKDIPRYSAEIADQNAKWQATVKGPSLKLDKNHFYAAEISRRILAGESPDEIVGDMKKEGSGLFRPLPSIAILTGAISPVSQTKILSTLPARSVHMLMFGRPPGPRKACPLRNAR